MELIGAFTDREQGEACARHYGGRLLCDPRAETSHLPFAAMVSIATDAPSRLFDSADVGVYVGLRREVKPRVMQSASTWPMLPGKIAVFPMVRRGDLSHEQADAHWRDVHAPLALRVHVAMSSYVQLSIVHVIRGPVWDGIAQCGFDSIEDLRTRFYESKAGQRAIEEDVASFADPKQSPRRLICDEYLYS